MNNSMRRSERQLNSSEDIATILRNAHTAYISFICDDAPAIVPMNFGFEYDGDQLYLYFHGAPSGRKAEAWRHDPRVEAAITGTADVIVSNAPVCHSTCKYAGVIVQGTMSELTDPAEKCRALSILMHHLGAEGEFDFPEKMMKATALWALKATNVTAKSNIKKN